MVRKSEEGKGGASRRGRSSAPVSATVDAIRPIKKTHEGSLLARAGVTGVDIGPKYVKGQKTAELSIRVYVRKKRDVPPREQIPKTIDGIKTDVIQRTFVPAVQRIRALDLKPAVDAANYSPLKGGISIGPCRVSGGFVYVGTLGAIVIDNVSGNPRLLSNYHVMCLTDGTHSFGTDRMAQPSRVDGGQCPANWAGTLQNGIINAHVDCAISDINARQHRCEIVDIGPVRGVANAVVGSAVRKRGRTSLLTHGTVDSTNLTVSIDYGGAVGVVVLQDQIGIDVDTAQSPQFGIGGDSGSVVVDSQNRIVGLFFGSNEEERDAQGNIVTPEGIFGVANPINEVLTALNVRMCIVPLKPPIKEFKDRLPKERNPKENLQKELLPKEFLPKERFPKESLPKELLPKEIKEFLPKELAPKEVKEFKEVGPKEFKELEPKGLEPKLLEPKGLEPKGLEPKGLEPKLLEPKGLEPKGLEPKAFEPKRLEPKGFEPKGMEPGPLLGGDPRTDTDRLSRLEQAVEALTHFIAGSDRPDLSLNALYQEEDTQLSAKLQKDASDAKQAKELYDTSSNQNPQ